MPGTVLALGLLSPLVGIDDAITRDALSPASRSGSGRGLGRRARDRLRDALSCDRTGSAQAGFARIPRI